MGLRNITNRIPREAAPFHVRTSVLVWQLPDSPPIGGRRVDVVTPRDDRPWDCSSLSPYSRVHSMPRERRRAFVLQEFARLVLDYALDPLEVHEALLKVEEYREALGRDMVGSYA